MQDGCSNSSTRLLPRFQRIKSSTAPKTVPPAATSVSWQAANPRRTFHIRSSLAARLRRLSYRRGPQVLSLKSYCLLGFSLGRGSSPSGNSQPRIVSALLDGRELVLCMPFALCSVIPLPVYLQFTAGSPSPFAMECGSGRQRSEVGRGTWEVPPIGCVYGTPTAQKQHTGLSPESKAALPSCAS